MKFELNGNIFKQDDNGNWVLEKAQIPKMKGNKKYKDAPRYGLIYDYENNVKENWKKTTDDILKDLKKKMNEFVK
jgi:hypothetical protein